MFILITSRNYLLNTDKIIDAKYYPGHGCMEFESRYDPSTGKPRPPFWVSARLDIVTSQLVSGEIAKFDGETVGGVSVSKEMTFYGVDAERTWEALTKDAYIIPALVEFIDPDKVAKAQNRLCEFGINFPDFSDLSDNVIRWMLYAPASELEEWKKELEDEKNSPKQ